MSKYSNKEIQLTFASIIYMYNLWKMQELGARDIQHFHNECGECWIDNNLGFWTAFVQGLHEVSESDHDFWRTIDDVGRIETRF